MPYLSEPPVFAPYPSLCLKNPALFSTFQDCYRIGNILSVILQRNNNVITIKCISIKRDISADSRPKTNNNTYYSSTATWKTKTIDFL